MLKAHQACIDLEKNVLRIQGREVQFLAEHALPAKARDSNAPIDAPGQPGPSTSMGSVSPGPSSRPAQFPGSGHSLGRTPTSPHRGGAVGTRPGSRGATAGSRYSERDIETIVSLGVSREVAISTLDAAGGNVDVAASLLF
jgi:DNA damage-inducible protein 1